MALLEPTPELPKKDAVDESMERKPILEPSFEEPKRDLAPAKPILFPKPQIIANYDWIDMASATGYILFDGFNAKDSAGDKYILIEATHSPDLMGTGTSDVPVTAVTGNSGTSFDKDFDLSEFQLPKTLEGNAFVRISISCGANPINTVTIVAKLRKWTGAEVEIVSTTSDSFGMSASTDYFRTLKLVVPKTHFKKGEQLRLTIQVTTDDNDTYKIGHNPDDTAIGNLEAGNSRLVVAIPFKLDFM